MQPSALKLGVTWSSFLIFLSVMLWCAQKSTDNFIGKFPSRNLQYYTFGMTLWMQWICVTVVHSLQVLLRWNVTLNDSVFISFMKGISNIGMCNTKTVSKQCTPLGFSEMWKLQIKLSHNRSWRLRWGMECWAYIFALTFSRTTTW